MKQIELKLVRDESGSTLFTFVDEETQDVLFTKSFNLDESYTIEVREDFNTFSILHNGSNGEFDFVSASVE